MSDNQRIDDLRRRVQKDPASIAFAQLAEECRRAAEFQESVDVCRAGLAIHPGYLSARVTLGRALIELNELDDAQTELELVLRSAPENLAAIRGLAEIHHRRGSLSEALAQYRAALSLARNDPDLQQTVLELERAVEPPKALASADGLSFEQASDEFLKHLPPPPVRTDAVDAPELAAAPLAPREAASPPVPAAAVLSEAADSEPLQSIEEPIIEPLREAVFEHVGDDVAFEPAAERERAMQTIAALEQWLDAIHVARTQPYA
jgi:tetratricopeptide (TPR) repeat protein